MRGKRGTPRGFIEIPDYSHTLAKIATEVASIDDRPVAAAMKPPRGISASACTRRIAALVRPSASPAFGADSLKGSACPLVRLLLVAENRKVRPAG